MSDLTTTILAGVVGGAAVVSIWWYTRVTRIRSKFSNPSTGKSIPGSNNFPMVDYLVHGFTGRNTLAPYGDFELSFFLGFPAVMVSDPVVIKELLKGNGVKDFDKGEMTLAGVEVIAGRENLFSLDGAAWQHMRIVIDPAFRPNLIRLLSCTIASTVNKSLEAWTAKPPTDLFSAISNVTLDIICQAAFGISASATVEAHPVASAYKVLLNGLMMKMVGLGYFYNKALDEASQEIETMAREVLDSCRRSRVTGQAPNSLIGLMLAHEDASSVPDKDSDIAADSELASDSSGSNKTLTDREIVDNIKIFLFAGHDSTASTMLWVLYLLAVHPHYQERVRSEFKALQGSLGQECMPSYEQLKTGLPFVHCVLKETLRMYPPAWTINRSPKKDVVLGGFSIPKGTAIMINTLRLHRREDLGWERPLDFMPERWQTEEAHYSKAAFTYIPFGGGPRTCIGQPLAEIEMLTVLYSVLLKFECHIVGSSRSCDIDYFSGATIRPKNIGNLRIRLLE